MSAAPARLAGQPGLPRRTAGPVSIAYEVRGESGPFLVMVHGLGYGRWGWGEFAELLAGSRRVVLIDNRGIGDSDCPPGPYSVEEMASDVLAVLDDLAIENCDLLGASLGGMIALELALRWPERLNRLVLVAATAGERAVPLPDSTRNLLRGEMNVTPETPRRLVAGALSPVTLKRRPGLVDFLLELRRQHPQDPAAWRAQAAASAGFAASRSLAVFRKPALVIAGLDDAVIDPAASAHLGEELPDARVELLPDLGHLSFFEAPGRLARLVADFLAAEPEILSASEGEAR